MKTEVKESGRFERTLTVRISSEELATAKKKAAAKLSASMKIKGFRPGKAPVAVVERTAGAGYLRSEAIEEAIRKVIPAAIDDAGLEPVTVPAVSDIRDEFDDGTVEVDVVVTLWPVLEALPDLGDFEIEVEPVDVTQEAIDEQIDALRNQFAELEDHEGKLSAGDFAMIDITATVDGEEIPEAAARDMMYEVGSASFIDGLDAILEGASAGSTVHGEATLPEGYTDHGGQRVTLEVVIREAKKKTLPDLTDEMAADATEFETAAELLAALERNMLAFNIHTQRRVLQDKVIQYVLNEIDLDLPEALIAAEIQARVRNLSSRLESDHLSIEDYLRIVGKDEEAFIADTRAQAENALATRVLLESIAAIENYEVTDDDLRDQIRSMLQGQEADVDAILEVWKSGGQVESLTGDILRDKALLSLIESATPVDSDGNAVDLTPVEIDEPQQENPQNPDQDPTDGVGEDDDPSPEPEDAPNEPEESL
ncbi:MAG: trigger factor [Acidimicrobiia bacterium]